MQRRYRIHPAIGIARVGNADSGEFFVGPEIPGAAVTGAADAGTAVPPFKSDKDKEKVKPQAARFRIWEYAKNVDGKWEASREIDLAADGVRSIEWKVHLANCKASFHDFAGPAGDTKPPAARRNPWKTKTRNRFLDIDFGPRRISGTGKPGVEFRYDPKKPKSQTGPYYAEGHPKAGEPVIDYLGELRTDASGRLIVIGGKGRADSFVPPDEPDVGQYAEMLWAYDNETWFDDISDGPVTATLSLEIDGKLETPKVEGAWVVVGPPDFAPDLREVLPLYDVLFDLAVWDLDLPGDEALYDGELANLRALNEELRVKRRKQLEDYVVDYAAEIEPVLVRLLRAGAVNKTVRDNHAGVGGSGNEHMRDYLVGTGKAADGARANVFERLRPHKALPKGFARAKSGPRDMPRQFGDDYRKDSLALTRTLYALFERWNRGGFKPGKAKTATAITPHGLDRAALESMLGGALHPGIEVGWLIRSPKLYAAPFRLDPKAKSTYWGEGWKTIGPGHFTRQLSVPWHSDFYHCAGAVVKPEYAAYHAWWPAQRPDEVKRKGGKKGEAVAWFRPSKGAWKIKPRADGETAPQHRRKMLENWQRLGFVVDSGGEFVEDERATGEFT